jgi:hypothetical protein
MSFDIEKKAREGMPQGYDMSMLWCAFADLGGGVSNSNTTFDEAVHSLDVESVWGLE